MRQIISTAVVAVVVGAIAGATMGAVAQSGPEATAQQAIVPAVTSLNAHKVDGRHAVSASASRKKRAGKLVATNRQGYLPNNIIKPAWKLIGGKPPAFADGRITWGEVQGKPGGFADGVDNSHRNTLLALGATTVFTVTSVSTFNGYEVPSSNVRISVEPITPDRYLEVRDFSIKKDGGNVTYRASWTVENLDSGLGSASFRLWVTDFGTGPNGPTASQIKAARSLETGKVRKGK